MIEYKDIRPGFYFCKRKPVDLDNKSIALVTGVFPFFRVNLWEPIIVQGGVMRDDMNMEKAGLIFTECIKELDND